MSTLVGVGDFTGGVVELAAAVGGIAMALTFTFLVMALTSTFLVNSPCFGLQEKYWRR